MNNLEIEDENKQDIKLSVLKNSPKRIKKSSKLEGVCYDIRGPVMTKALQMEQEGLNVLKLNIGNLAAFGFDAPEEIVLDMSRHLRMSAGYSESKGMFAARKAIMHETQKKDIANVSVDDIFIGNGASELIMMAMQALLDNGDEVLIPSPDYPLWTAAVNLSGGKAVHYLCDEQQDWQPDIEDIERKITAKTKAMVIINPNNPTGAVYSRECLLKLIDVARRHQLVFFSDEIYDKVLYDGIEHISAASLANDLVFVTLNGLSKNYRCCGFRAGWMIISGDLDLAHEFMEGLNMLSSMRLCPNVPAQWAIQTALGGFQSIDTLVAPEGRLTRQRDLAHRLLNEIPGVQCVKPKGALYLFPRIDQDMYPIADDQYFALKLLETERLLIVQGSGFNWVRQDHFRMVFLPYEEDLQDAIARLARFLSTWQTRYAHHPS